MRLYILFNSIHFNSFHFYSIQRDEKNETLRMITKKTKITKNNENYEILRKKGNTLIKNHVIVIFYIVSVYFFIHAKNVFIAFFLFFVCFSFFRSFSFFSLISFLFVICELRFFRFSLCLSESFGLLSARAKVPVVFFRKYVILN